MNNRINQNNIKNINFNGTKSNAVKTTVEKGAEKMDELIKKMITDLKKQVKEKVIPVGDFDVVWEEFENPDKALSATHFLLKVSPTGVKGAEEKRYLEAAAIIRGGQYGSESVLALGSKQEILDKLNEHGLDQIIKQKFISLAKGLENI